MTGIRARDAVAGARTAIAVAIAAAVATTVLSAGGCSLYVPDEGVSRADIIQLTAEQPEAGYIADGQQSFTLFIDVDADTSATKDIVVTTSDGIVNFAADPADLAARTVTVRVAPGGDAENSARKIVEVPMVVGRTPGTVFVSAAVEGVEHVLPLVLAAAPPDVVVLQTSATALALDGVSRADLSATLLRDSGLVSLGTRVSWRVCCEDDQQTLDSCQGRTPLRVPTLSELAAGDTVATTAVSERMTAADFNGDDTPFDVFVVTRPIADGGQSAECAGAIADADAISIQVSPSP